MIQFLKKEVCKPLRSVRPNRKPLWKCTNHLVNEFNHQRVFDNGIEKRHQLILVYVGIEFPNIQFDKVFGAIIMLYPAFDSSPCFVNAASGYGCIGMLIHTAHDDGFNGTNQHPVYNMVGQRWTVNLTALAKWRMNCHVSHRRWHPAIFQARYLAFSICRHLFRVKFSLMLRIIINIAKNTFYR